MRTLRGNILAVSQHPMERLASQNALREMHDPNCPAQPPLPKRTGPRALTISLMLSAPAPVESAGIS